MNPEEKIEEFIRQLDFTTNPDTDKHILDDAVAELVKSTRSRRPAAPVVKIATAVIVLAAIVTGLIILLYLQLNITDSCSNPRNLCYRKVSAISITYNNLCR